MFGTNWAEIANSSGALLNAIKESEDKGMKTVYKSNNGKAYTLTQCQDIFLAVLPENYVNVLRSFELIKVLKRVKPILERGNVSMCQGVWEGRGDFKGVKRSVSVELTSFEREANKEEQ